MEKRDEYVCDQAAKVYKNSFLSFQDMRSMILRSSFHLTTIKEL